jgi:hypothetical protein
VVSVSFRRSEFVSLIVGALVVAAGLVALYLPLPWVYRWLSPADALPAGALTMGVYFEDEANEAGLRVYGDVLENGKPVVGGHAHVTVRRLNDALVQSVSVPVTGGRFDSSTQPAFKTLRASDRLNIGVEVSRADSTRVAKGETYLNAYPPLRPSSIRWTAGVLLGIAVVFFWAFTGVATPRKNQAAIIFSYVVMLLFLCLPFMAFYVLGRYQAVAQVAQDVAGSTPVGVLPAVPLKDSDGKLADGVEREWVLNIGGLVTTRRVSNGPPVPPRQSNGAAAKEGEEPKSSRLQGDTVVEVGAEGRSPVVGTQGRPTDGSPDTASEIRREHVTSSGVPDYIIEGGIVIPLYVLVLSIIGGAINMTRMLPIYQREAQTLINPREWLRTVGGTVIAKGLGPAPPAASPSGPADGPSLTANASSSMAADAGTLVSILATPSDGADTSGPPAVKVAVTPARPNAAATELGPPLPPDFSSPSSDLVAPERTTTVTAAPATTTQTPVEVAAVWRQGLITQHMYLLAAPFLAIAVFYLLDWLDMQKKPLLVLSSLSVGLTSDKILSAILSVVVPILGRSGDAKGLQVDVQTPQ